MPQNSVMCLTSALVLMPENASSNVCIAVECVPRTNAANCTFILGKSHCIRLLCLLTRRLSDPQRTELCCAGMYCATVARVQTLCWTEIVPHVLCSCAVSNVERPGLLHQSRLDLLPGHLAVRSPDLEAPVSSTVNIACICCGGLLQFYSAMDRSTYCHFALIADLPYGNKFVHKHL